MALVEMVMPKMGESIMEGTVLSWLKKVGDTIEQDESVLEVATDKVDTEVPSTHAGILKEILAEEGDVIEVGKPIAIISTDSNDVSLSENSNIATFEKSKAILAAVVATTVLEKPISNRFYSPLVLNIARKENISMSELESVPGTGKEGRVTKRDILAYIKTHQTDSIVTPIAPLSTNGTTQPETLPIHTSVSSENEIIEMDRMRKMIAERMVNSKRISPHVTSFLEADVSNIVSWRNKYKHVFKQNEGQSLTFTPIFIEAIVRAIRDFPMVNISVEGTKIIKKKAINIGLAVALPSGNLIVPVIKNADQLNLKGIVLKVNDLANRAKINKLTPDDLSDGTYTVSNVGSFGNVMGTPIIMQPQVAILALGVIQKKPAVIETSQGDTIGIRHKMFLSHSYDHRVVDGALGGIFVRRVANYLEKFDVKRSI